MNKKIDYINDNKKNNLLISKSIKGAMSGKSVKNTKGKSRGKSTIAKSNPKSGSKNLKKIQPIAKKRGRRPKKILENFDEFESQSTTINKPKSKSKVSAKKNTKINKNKSNKLNLESESGSESESGFDVESEEYNSDSNKDDDKDNTQNEISSVICRLNIDSSRLDKYRKLKKKGPVKNVLTLENDFNNESDGMFRNDIPRDDICSKCVKNEKTIIMMKNKLDKLNNVENPDKIINKTYRTNLDIVEYVQFDAKLELASKSDKSDKSNKSSKLAPANKKINIKKTNIKCFWDTCTFTCLPSFLVELYHNNTYHVIGCFCSPNCALAYNLYYLRDSKVHQRKSLTIKLHKEIYGIAINEAIDIKESGPKELLEDYGGKYTISEYRKTFCSNKEYITYSPPIKSINNIIEERNTNNLSSDTNKKKYILKRTKPLTKKRSIMSSMNIVCDEEE